MCAHAIACGAWPLAADRAATDQHASNLTVIRDMSNIQSCSTGKTRLTTRHSRTARYDGLTPRTSYPGPHTPDLAPRPRTPDLVPQASYPRVHNPTQASRTHPPHPQLPNNVARNSPTLLSKFKIRSLKSCGFREVSKRPRRGITCEMPKLSTDFSNSSHEAL